MALSSSKYCSLVTNCTNYWSNSWSFSRMWICSICDSRLILATSEQNLDSCSFYSLSARVNLAWPSGMMFSSVVNSSLVTKTCIICMRRREDITSVSDEIMSDSLLFLSGAVRVTGFSFSRSRAWRFWIFCSWSRSSFRSRRVNVFFGLFGVSLSSSTFKFYVTYACY